MVIKKRIIVEEKIEPTKEAVILRNCSVTLPVRSIGITNIEITNKHIIGLNIF